MYKKISWNEFRDTGMLWFINRIIQVFGLSIMVSVDDDTGEVVSVFPVRTVARGFNEEVEDTGYLRVQKYLADNSANLFADVAHDLAKADNTEEVEE